MCNTAETLEEAEVLHQALSSFFTLFFPAQYLVDLENLNEGFVISVTFLHVGGSQPILTGTNEIVCADETVSYSCTVDSPSVQWIVEPFIPATGSGIFTLNNVPSTVGITFSVDPFFIQHLSMVPFVTVLTINAGAINVSVNVTCSTSGNNPERATDQLYILDDSKYITIFNLNSQ